jgi:ribonuclease PH
MTESGKFIEIQGTAENAVFDKQQLDEMLELAAEGIQQLIAVQKSC